TDHVADCANRPRRADRLIPSVVAKIRAYRLELQTGSDPRTLDALVRDAAVVEIAGAHAHAAHVEAFQLLGVLALTDDHFGAAAADVHDQPAPGLARHGMRHAKVDQTRFFDAGDDFDRMTECCAGAIQECALAPRTPQRIGADHAHAFRLHVVQPLTEAFQTSERGVDRLARQPPLLVEAGAESHHFAQTIDDDE